MAPIRRPGARRKVALWSTAGLLAAASIPLAGGLATASEACTTTWTGEATDDGDDDPDWGAAANWDDGVPGSGDVACIDADDAEAELTADGTVAGLHLSAGTVTVPDGTTLTVADDLRWSGGELAGDGTTDVTGDATLTGGTKELTGHTVTLHGDSDWDAGDLDISGSFADGVGSALLDNRGTLTLSADGGDTIQQTGGQNDPVLRNDDGATLRKQGADRFGFLGTTQLSGSIEVDAGALALRRHGATTRHDGTFRIGEDATLELEDRSGGTNTGQRFDGATLEGPGTVAVRDTGNGGAIVEDTEITDVTFEVPSNSRGLEIAGDATLVDGDIRLELAGGAVEIGEDVTLTVTDELIWSGGELTGDGTTEVTGDATLTGEDKQLTGHTLTLHGDATWDSGDLEVPGGNPDTPSLLDVRGTLTVDTDDELHQTGTALPVAVRTDADGTLTKTGGGLLSFHGTTFHAGDVDVEQGTLHLRRQPQATDAHTGTFTIADAAELRVAQTSSTDGRQRFDGATIAGPGTFGLLDAPATPTGAELSGGTVLRDVHLDVPAGGDALRIDDDTDLQGELSLRLAGDDESVVDLGRSIDLEGLTWTGGTLTGDDVAVRVTGGSELADDRTLDGVDLELQAASTWRNSDGGPAVFGLAGGASVSLLGDLTLDGNTDIGDLDAEGDTAPDAGMTWEDGTLDGEGTLAVYLERLQLAGGDVDRALTGETTLLVGGDLGDTDAQGTPVSTGRWLIDTDATVQVDGRYQQVGDDVTVRGALHVSGPHERMQRLDGDGDVGDEVVNFAVLAPGTPTGTLHVRGEPPLELVAIADSATVLPTLQGPPPPTGGDATLTPDGSLEITVDGADEGSFSQLLADGAVTLGGALDVAILDGAGLAAGDELAIVVGGVGDGGLDLIGDGPILLADDGTPVVPAGDGGAVSGAFDTIAIDGELAEGLEVEVVYDADEVLLVVTGEQATDGPTDEPTEDEPREEPTEDEPTGAAPVPGDDEQGTADGDALAYTGTDPWGLVLAGLVLLAAGVRLTRSDAPGRV